MHSTSEAQSIRQKCMHEMCDWRTDGQIGRTRPNLLSVPLMRSVKILCLWRFCCSVDFTIARTTCLGQKLWKSLTMRNLRRMSASCRDCVVGDNNTVVSLDTTAHHYCSSTRADRYGPTGMTKVWYALGHRLVRINFRLADIHPGNGRIAKIPSAANPLFRQPVFADRSNKNMSKWKALTRGRTNHLSNSNTSSCDCKPWTVTFTVELDL